MGKVEKIEKNGWVLHIHRPSSGLPERIILLLHGWTGDEEVMWVFARRLPKNALMIAPRGLYTTPLGGYGWHPYNPNKWPWVDDFLPTVEAFEGLLSDEQITTSGISHVSAVGFSQGAALAYAYALLRPYRFSSIAGLSGFLPEGAEALARNKPLVGKKIFIAHGTQDALVPVRRARNAVKLLGEAGAEVTYCEDEVGHKLSAKCFDGLRQFFKS
ncbi:MAG: hypothetical protein JSV61_14580 [Anaerolineales bacterium]|nr:MAG: hypothetical protein JSV61_14580 [Anaerolineales bacterium]